MTTLDIILKKRSGFELSREEIRFIIKGYVNEEIPDYQVSAFLMSVFFKGMTTTETALLTEEMILSGETIDLSEISMPKIDKHSTGGVGDNLSLMLAPLCSAMGILVPMMSGRGLGHTGGTLDKLESIPGYQIRLDIKRIKEILKSCGFVMMGQTDSIVPADKKLYSLRDVTGTVESIPLITASILSKKFAEGADALVMDVKCGKGAFMKNLDDSRKLAISLKQTGEKLNKNVKAIITAMDEPLGDLIGNFLEVKDAYNFLNGKYDRDKLEIILKLTGAMAHMAGITKNADEGALLSKQTLMSGKPLELFIRNIELQGGNPDFVVNTEIGDRVRTTLEVTCDRDGIINSVDSLTIGRSAVLTGAGRKIVTDRIDPMSGIKLLKKRGDSVNRNDVLALLYIEKDLDNSKEIAEMIKSAYLVTDNKPPAVANILEEI